MPVIDPVTMVYQRIRSVLLNDAAFSALLKDSAGEVRVANFPDMTNENQAEMFRSETPNTFPYVLLRQGAFVYVPFGDNSRAITIKQAYPLSIAHDSMNLSVVNMFNLRAFDAMRRSGLNLGGLGFVAGWEMQNLQDSFTLKPTELPVNAELNWVTVGQVNVLMSIDKNNLFFNI